MASDIFPSLKTTYKLLLKAIYNEVLFVTGPPSSGKTTLVKRAFEEDLKEKYLSAYVDCYSIPTQSRLFSTIIRAFNDVLNSSRSSKSKVKLPNSTESFNLCELPSVLNEYQRIAESKGFLSLYIILDHVETFEKTNLMDTFVALCRVVTQDLRSLRLVMISYEDPTDIVHYILQEFIPVGTGIQDRMQIISCSVWSKDDTVKWILQSAPKNEELQDSYVKFVKAIVSLVFTTDTKDPRQIRMYCQQNFASFLRYRDDKTRQQLQKLLKLGDNESIPEGNYALSEQHNTALVQTFVTHHCTITDKKRRRKFDHTDSELKMTTNTSALIVASYIAAHTRPADDKLNFIRRQTRRQNSRAASVTCTNRAFTLERLLQIYIKLMEQSVGARELHIIYNNDCALADVERLENLNILQHQGGYELSSEARYKLSPNIKQSYVQRLAEHISLSLDWFKGLSQLGEEK